MPTSPRFSERPSHPAGQARVISREAERWPSIRLTLEALTIMAGIPASTGFLLVT